MSERGNTWVAWTADLVLPRVAGVVLHVADWLAWHALKRARIRID